MIAESNVAVDKITFNLSSTENGGDDDETMGYIRFKVGGELLLTMKLRYNACCGLVEACNFDDYFRDVDLEKFKKVFHQAVCEIGRNFSKAIVHLTFHKYGSLNAEPNQPQWFLDAVSSYPGAIHMDWVLNPNSGNYIQMWMLPTGAKM